VELGLRCDEIPIHGFSGGRHEIEFKTGKHEDCDESINSENGETTK
jgi:hypothetical protein